jgi:hypothetical protein
MRAPKRSKKYLDGAPPYVMAIYDSGSKYWDRYTVVYGEPIWSQEYAERNIKLGFGRLYPARAMSRNPFHPQGFGQFIDAARGPHLGKLIHWKDLPPDCQKCVLQDGKDS